MIKQLTPEQEAKIPEYVERGLKVGLSTEPINKTEVESAMNSLYKAHGYAEPRIYYARSPREGMAMTQALRENGLMDTEQLAEIIKHQKTTWQPGAIYGNQDLEWLYLYKFINDELPVEKFNGPLEETLRVAELCGWYWPHDNYVVVTERPVKYSSKNNVLHCEDGPAIEYSDGYAVYVLNGVRMSGVEHLMSKDANPKDILNVKNAEQRAELIKLFGIDKLFYELNPQKLDTYEGYELYSVMVYEGIPRIYLKMNNPSVDEVHIEAVHPDCTTVKQALAWRNTGTVTDDYISPMVLT